MKKKFIIAIIVLYLVMLGLYVQWAFEHYIAGTMFFSAIFLGSIIIGYISYHKIHHKFRKYSPFLYTISILSGLVLISGFTVMAAQNFITLHRAEKLINNINHYQKASGHLPESLNELQPEYMSSIPRVAGGLKGRTFEYSNGKGYDEPFVYFEDKTTAVSLDKNEYYLKFKTYFGVVYFYDSKTQQWQTIWRHTHHEPDDRQYAFSGMLFSIWK